MIKSKKQMYLVIGVFALVLMLFTTTYAFFNYTRTGTINVIKTGRIYFNSEQGTSINLTNLFPIDVSEGIPNDNTKVGTVTINITGDTTYGEGIEYLVSAVNVTNTVGSKNLPISIDVSVTNNTENDPVTNLGTSDDDYFEDRGSTTSYYKVLATDTIEDNSELLVGYIAPGATGVDGNIVIKAYLDASKIAISDTYPEGDVTHTEGGEPNQTTVIDYTNGTTTEWVNDREVFTTTEWNSLQTNGVSFQVKVEANEGTWVEESSSPTCPGPQCVYTIYGQNTIGTPINGVLGVDYDTDISQYATDDGNVFLAHILNGTIIQESYACGMNNGNIYCLRGGIDESSLSEKPIFNDNINRLNAAFPNCNASNDVSQIECEGSLASGKIHDSGDVITFGYYDCLINMTNDPYTPSEFSRCE